MIISSHKYVNLIIFMILEPPSLPIVIGTSPTGKGADHYPFPLGGNKKGGRINILKKL
jgi:hypothetical protein